MSGKTTPKRQRHIQSLKQKKRHLEAFDQDTLSHLSHSNQSVRSNVSTGSQSTLMRRFGNAVGQYVASPVVESMDMNAILDHVDWNEVLDKVDINEVFLDKIDVNRLLARVDVNRHLDRVDVNRHLDKVDWDAIIERSNLEDIISRSTTGVLTGFASLVRTRIAWCDQWGQRLGRCYCCCGKNSECVDLLPPRPGRPEDSQCIWEDPLQLDKPVFETAIQFRTCGALNRLLYNSLDLSIGLSLYALFAAIVNELTKVFTNDPDYWQTMVPITETTWFEPLVYVIATALYWVFMVGCTGRTIGMWMLGILMVSEEGNRVNLWQVCKQLVLMPLNILVFGWAIGLARRDGAQFSDLVGGVRIVYCWDALGGIPSKRHNMDMAMSVGDFVSAHPDHEKESLLRVPENLKIQLGSDDYDGDDASLGNHSHSEYHNAHDHNGGDIEITNLEDGASQWTKDNI